MARFRDRLAAMQAQLEEMKATIAAARLTMEPTMRRHLCCPACGGRRIAHALSVLDRGDSSSAPLALHQPKWWSSKAVGELEAFICRACGYVEWYVKEPATLAPHPEYMEFVDGPEVGGGGPYR
jgi:hypothetical protein